MCVYLQYQVNIGTCAIIHLLLIDKDKMNYQNKQTLQIILNGTYCKLLCVVFNISVFFHEDFGEDYEDEFNSAIILSF